MKGIFRVIAEEKDIVQNKGVRAFITEQILISPSIKSGIAINLEDGKTVEVRLEGEKKAIFEFIEKLKKELIAQFGNPTISISDFEENNFVEIPDVQRSGQALMLNQLQKGINVQFKILNGQKEVVEAINNISCEIKNMSSEFKTEMKSMSTELKNGMQNMSSEFKTEMKNLPKNIALALKPQN